MSLGCVHVCWQITQVPEKGQGHVLQVAAELIMKEYNETSTVAIESCPKSNIYETSTYFSCRLPWQAEP